jgi:hypothetical protein
MASEAGKGDKQRPTNHDAFAKNFEEIFGGKPKANYEIITCQRCGQSMRVNTFDEYSGIHTCTPLENQSVSQSRTGK